MAKHYSTCPRLSVTAQAYPGISSEPGMLPATGRASHQTRTRPMRIAIALFIIIGLLIEPVWAQAGF